MKPLAPLLLATLLSVPRALADDAAGRNTARALYAEATKLSGAGAYREALAKFEGAYAATPTPIIGLGWARAHEALGELIEARERASAAIQLPVQKAETQRSAVARDELDRLVLDLSTRIPRVTLLVGSDDTELAIAINDSPLQKALFGQPLFRNPGRYELNVYCGKAKVRSSTIELKASEHREIDLTLLATACTKKVASTKSRQVSEGLIVGGAITFVPFVSLPPGDIPDNRKFSAALGLTAELGYAISPRMLLLLRALVSFGPQGNPASYLASAGPTLLVHLTDPVWLNLCLHGGRAQTHYKADGPAYTSDWVFSTQAGIEVTFAERDYGYWYAGGGLGVILANVNAKDTPFFYAPFSLGLRTY